MKIERDSSPASRRYALRTTHAVDALPKLRKAQPRPHNMNMWLNRLDQKKSLRVTTALTDQAAPKPLPAPTGKRAKGAGALASFSFMDSFFMPPTIPASHIGSLGAEAYSERKRKYASYDL